MSHQRNDLKCLNASNIRCPDLFLVMRMFINEHKSSVRYIQINTKDERSEARVKQICINYDYEYKSVKMNDEYVFMIDLQPSEVAQLAS